MRGSTGVSEWNDCLQSSLIVARRKKLRAQKIALQGDHGERCRRFKPFLQSPPIITHQDYVAFCKEEEPSFQFFGNASRDEKSWQACFNDHFHEKSGLRVWWGKFEALCPEMRLSPHERMIAWLFLYQLTAWQTISGRGTWDAPQRNPRQYWAWPCWASRHENCMELLSNCPQHCRKRSSDTIRSVWTPRCINIATRDRRLYQYWSLSSGAKCAHQ